MNNKLEPLKTESLKEVFIAKFEELILSGHFSIGEKLPSERELARQLGVSRPVVHEGLVDLVAKGLVTMKPRVGTIVNDFRRHGSLALLTSLVNYQEGNLDRRFVDSLLGMRMLFEVENARLAALNRTEKQLEELKSIISNEEKCNIENNCAVTELDFSFHLQVAIASGNMIYPLLMNSFKNVYTSLSGVFFTEQGVADTVFTIHRNIVDAIARQDQDGTVSLMTDLLNHGEEHLRHLIN